MPQMIWSCSINAPLPMIDPSEKCFSVNDGQYVFDMLNLASSS